MASDGLTIFYNTKVAALSLGYSLVSGRLQISIAKALNPNKKGRPQAGESLFDWDNKGSFSISPEEAVPIDYLWDMILSGEYTNPKPNKPDQDKYYNVTHFRENQATILSLIRSDNPGRPNDPVMAMGLFINGERYSYKFRKPEMIIFREFIRFTYQRLPMELALTGAREKRQRLLEFQKNERNNNSNNTRQNRGNQYDRGTNYSGGQQEEQPQRPPQNQQRVPDPEMPEPPEHLDEGDIPF